MRIFIGIEVVCEKILKIYGRGNFLKHGSRVVIKI